MTHLPILQPDTFADLAARRDELARGLARAVAGEVRFGLHDRMLYATDASIYQVEPLGVVIPDSIEDVIAAVRYCAGHGLPILPRGGGTSLAGQCTNEAVVLDLSVNCGAVRKVSVEQKTCEVDAGMTVDQLNRYLKPTGLFFAPDPATVRQANIGGCIGNNAAGTRSIRYGRTSENIDAIDALLASGERVAIHKAAAKKDPVARRLTEGVIDIVRRHRRLIEEKFPKTLRRNAGYGLDSILKSMKRGDPIEEVNLTDVLCGSEGTLAITLGATLRLHHIPACSGLVVLGFDSLDSAVEAVPRLLETKPSAVELLDDLILETASHNPALRPTLDLLPAPRSGPLRAVLFVEFLEHEQRTLEQKHAEVRERTREAPGVLMMDPGSIDAMRRLRVAGEPLLHAIAGDRKPIGFVEDNVVPVERLGEFVRRFRAIVEEHGTRAAFYAHASVGVLHVRPLLNLRREDDREAMLDIAVRVADLAGELGGVMSGEHGDGRARGPLLERHFGPELMGAFREVKALFDPDGLLNPGNIVSPGPIESIVERTRIRPKGHDIPSPHVETYFLYDEQEGFGAAVERCNGAGVCRKREGGTMCPSYMATLEERDSTRGRGNALRLALSGQFGSDPLDWNDAETIRTLDLCLSCKACKSECPSGVDMARLKAEFTAQRYALGHAPLRARLLGRYRVLARLASMTPSLSRRFSDSGIGRWMIGSAMGFSPQRSFPEFRRPLHRVMPPPMDRSTAVPTVVFFGDCFSMFSETGIGLDARRVLEAFGYRVVLADVGCCQRPAISTGLLPSAIRGVDRMVSHLERIIEREQPEAVLVAEPSCLSAIRDEWLSLRCETDRGRRERIATKSFLVEQFLHERWDRHPHRPQFSAPTGRVLLHGHCHQKALWGMESSAGVLRRAFGDRLVELETGCCGMAGGFGFSRDRFDLSMKIGELTLLPAVRERGEADLVVAPGTSCRHQIRDGAQHEAIHPVQALAQYVQLRTETDTSGLAPSFARG
ncbi:MAG TPA: FAD-binding oxidoreductase [Phycisphaerales bacterium]|nr:FAD-binding oxidoreductase [Phycisphaerales bacterium]